MSRPRLYANPAERQRAFRQRLAAIRAGQQVAPPPQVKRKKPPSRPARLEQSIKDLEALATEYEDWLAALPEPLQESALGDKLRETVEQLTAAADLLREVDPPKGFGRD
jgi:hypothetical protein